MCGGNVVVWSCPRGQIRPATPRALMPHPAPPRVTTAAAKRAGVSVGPQAHRFRFCLRPHRDDVQYPNVGLFVRTPRLPAPQVLQFGGSATPGTVALLRCSGPNPIYRKALYQLSLELPLSHWVDAMGAAASVSGSDPARWTVDEVAGAVERLSPRFGQHRAAIAKYSVDGAWIRAHVEEGDLNQRSRASAWRTRARARRCATARSG